MRRIGRIPAGLGVAAAALALSAGPALGHVTANPRQATAGGYTYHAFRVGHGCEVSPTTKVAVSIPDGVTSVKPQEVTGWEIDITMGAITPYESDGEAVSEGVTEVSWTGGPLPDTHMQQFGLSMKMPDRAGETIYFPVVQTCEEGVHRWIAIPVEGEEEPDEPAPGVMLLAAEGDGQGSAAGTEESATDTGDADPVAQSGEVDGDDSDTLAVVALIVGIAGLLTGGAALVRTRS